MLSIYAWILVEYSKEYGEGLVNETCNFFQGTKWRLQGLDLGFFFSYRFEAFVYFNDEGFKRLQNDVISYFSFEDPIEKLG